MPSIARPALFIITGAMAAGKSTVAEALARRLPKSVHLRGDVFRKMIVNGAAEMGPVLSPEAVSQLALRRNLACVAAKAYMQAGFSVVYQDILIGEALQQAADDLSDLSPVVVVLEPRVDVLAKHDKQRNKSGYGGGFPPDILARALQDETPRIGLWVDNSDMSVDAVVDRILESSISAAGPD